MRYFVELNSCEWLFLFPSSLTKFISNGLIEKCFEVACYYFTLEAFRVWNSPETGEDKDSADLETKSTLLEHTIRMILINRITYSHNVKFAGIEMR